MKISKLRLTILLSILTLAMLASCSNPMVTTLLIAPIELDNITVTAVDSTGNDAELNYGIQPNFVKGKHDYYAMVPRHAKKIIIKGISNKGASVWYKMITSSNATERASGVFEDFEFPEKSCTVELHVSMKNMDPSMYMLTIYRMMPAWITKMELTSSVAPGYIYPFSPGYNPSIPAYSAGINYNSEDFSLKCHRRLQFNGDERIKISFQNEDGSPMNTSADITTGIWDSLLEEWPSSVESYVETVPVLFPYDEFNPANTMMEKIIRVVVSFPEEDPEPLVYTIKVRRPSRVIAKPGEENCFAISGAEKNYYFQQGEPVSFTVTPPFGKTRAGINAVSDGRSVTLFASGSPLPIDAASYSFIMPGNEVVLSGQWDEIPAATYTNVRYVWEHGTGDGTKWCKASGNLQNLIDGYTGVYPNNYEIWIAKGTVIPEWSWVSGGPKPAWANAITAGSNFTNWDSHCFVLKNGVRIYGGFRGIEQTNGEKDSRDTVKYETILSGFKKDEGYTRHLVVAVGINGIPESTILEGVTITKSEAGGRETNITIAGATLDLWLGAGIYTVNCTNALLFNKVKLTELQTMVGAGAMNTNSSPIFRKCEFSKNSAYRGGGGMANDGNSAPLIENCIFTGNHSGLGSYGLAPGGGGILNGATSKPIIRNTEIYGNFSGDYGGGICNKENSEPIIENCRIYGNTATTTGGGISNIGNSEPIFENCKIYGNRATTNGGGIHSVGASKPLIQYCEIYENISTADGGGVYTAEIAETTIINCKIFDNESISGQGGGIHLYGTSVTVSSVTAVNTLITGNKVRPVFAGVYQNAGIHAQSKISLINVTIANNINGRDLYLADSSSSSIIKNTIAWGSTAVASQYTASQINGGAGITSDSQITAGTTSISTIGLNASYRPTALPCLNGGDYAAYNGNGFPAVDLASLSRFSGTQISIGAYQ